MAWSALAKYADEAHTLRSPLFLNAQGEAASNVDLAAWDADLALLQKTRDMQQKQILVTE